MPSFHFVTLSTRTRIVYSIPSCADATRTLEPSVCGTEVSYSRSSPPTLADETKAVFRVANVFADLGSIPLEQFPKVSPPGRKPYYVADFSVAMTIENNISFKIMYNGKEYGSVTAQFD